MRVEGRGSRVQGWVVLRWFRRRVRDHVQHLPAEEMLPRYPSSGQGVMFDPQLVPQGYLAHEKQPPRRTLLEAYAHSPMMVLGGFLMNEVPL